MPAARWLPARVGNVVLEPSNAEKKREERAVRESLRLGPCTARDCDGETCRFCQNKVGLKLAKQSLINFSETNV